MIRLLLSLAALVCLAEPSAAAPPLSGDSALASDAAQYSARFAVSADEALRRLKAQQASVPVTDAISREFADRLAGIAIEHSPAYRIVVLLTGSDPVADRTAGTIPVTFRTGARATRAEAVLAMRRHLIDLRRDLPGSRGAGFDQRTGQVVLLVRSEDAEHYGLDAIRARAEAVSGVPVRIAVNDLDEANMAIETGSLIEGGVRLEGLQDGRRRMCTSGFVVTDGSRDAIATAAHCPDELTYRDDQAEQVPLAFVGQWGVAYQDVQVNLSPKPAGPLFYADRLAGELRAVESWRNLASTRAGDFVCHWGESSHYSCGLIELTDYAPPGELCGGPCQPSWVTVEGPSCIPGDSGGPVFSGSVAFGIAKGINRRSDGRCAFYYYMSTDYLPTPWRLRHTGDIGLPTR